MLSLLALRLSQFQNNTEILLLLTTSVILALAAIYGTFDTTTADYVLIFEVSALSLMSASILGSVVFLYYDYRQGKKAMENLYIRKMKGGEEVDRFIDEPVRCLLEKGVIRLLRCAWLIDDNADEQLPHTTSVKSEFTFQCGATASRRATADLKNPDTIACITERFAECAKVRHLSVWVEVFESQGEGGLRLIITVALSSFLEVALTRVALDDKAETVKLLVKQMSKSDIQKLFAARLTTEAIDACSLTSVDIDHGRPFLPRCQDLEAMEQQDSFRCFASPDDAVAAWRNKRRQVYVLSYGWRMAGQPDPDGLTLSKVRKHLKKMKSMETDATEPSSTDRFADKLLFWE